MSGRKRTVPQPPEDGGGSRPIRLPAQEGTSPEIRAVPRARANRHSRPQEAAGEGAVLAVLVALVRRLEQENRELAEEVGYLRARLEQAPPRRLRTRAVARRSAGSPRKDALSGVSASALISWVGRRWQAIPRPRRLAYNVAVVVLPSLALFLVLSPLLQTFRVGGDSMEPSLQSGQLLLVNKAAYWRRDAQAFVLGGPQRGELAVLHAPAAGGAALIKRIIGLPGDAVVIRDGELFLNGRHVDEPYVAFRDPYTYPADGQPLLIPDGNFFVLGDNRPGSVDSHLGWLVPAESLVGKAWLSYWPPSTWGGVPKAALLASGAPDTPPADAFESDANPSPAGPAPTPAPNPVGNAPPPLSLAPLTAPTARVLLDQRFGQVLPGWPNDRGGHAWFADGGYQVAARDPSRFVAIAAPLGAALRDAVVSATFRKIGGPPGGGFGLIVRDQGPGPRDGVNQGGRYYVLEVGDTGEVGIWRRADDRWLDIQPWTHSPAVRPPTAPNELEARTRGQRLTLVVNGVEVVSQTDAALAEGGVGIFVGGDGNQVLVERFAVSRVDEE